MIRTPKEITAGRRIGAYVTKETRDETILCHSQKGPQDLVYTIIKRLGQFSVYNLTELAPQIRSWRDLKCVIDDKNIFSITVGDKSAWLFVVQPPNMDETNSSICPLALAHGVMVSGWSYIAWDKTAVDLCLRLLRWPEFDGPDGKPVLRRL